jgi:formylglycine-generating enzyme required for sulfatase activity
MMIDTRTSTQEPPMRALRYSWNTHDTGHAFDLVYVEGTNGRPYFFGDGADRPLVEVQDFFIGTVPVTQALWAHVVGVEINPAVHRGAEFPLENVSRDEITRRGGFLDRINDSPVRVSTTVGGRVGVRSGRPPLE